MEDPASSAAQEGEWVALCTAYFENAQEQEDARLAIEYFQSMAPDGSQVLGRNPSLGQGDGIALLTLLDRAGLRTLGSAERWYHFNDLKNKARAGAHASGTARRLENTKNTIETICAHSRRRTPTYAQTSKVLSRFLKTHGHEMGLGPVIGGLHRWVLAHVDSAVCHDFSLPGEIFSERKVEFTESFCLVLCHLGTLVSIVDKDFNECHFVWRYHPHISDKYSVRASRRISRLGLNVRLSTVNSSGNIIESSVRRENMCGQHDSMYNYALNAMLCPIL